MASGSQLEQDQDHQQQLRRGEKQEAGRRGGEEEEGKGEQQGEGEKADRSNEKVTEDGGPRRDINEPRPTTSRAESWPRSQQATPEKAGSCENGASVRTEGSGPKDEGEESPEAEKSASPAPARPCEEGAGMYKVHTIPMKLMSKLTSHEIAAVWPLLKYEIGKKIWGREQYEPVPTVVEGAVERYELGAVLMKSRLTPRERWRCLPPRCQAVASIFDLIWEHDLTVHAAVEFAATVKQQDKLWPNHRFHGLVLTGGYCRQVTVTASGCHAVMPRALPRPDSLVLNLYRYSGRFRTDKIYVVSEVIYAQELHVGVRVSINRDDVKILHRVPLAFRLHSYDVRDMSTLMHRQPYTKPLRVRWTGLTDTEHPSIYPRRTRGMGDVNKRLDIVRQNQGVDLFPNRNGRTRNVDNGGDRRPVPAAPHRPLPPLPVIS